MNREIKLSKINFRGHEGYVIESRIRQDEKRDDLHYYHIRHDDEGLGDPVTLEDIVLVNHWGTMCFKESIDHLFTAWGEGRLETDLTQEESDAIVMATNGMYPDGEIMLDEDANVCHMSI